MNNEQENPIEESKMNGKLNKQHNEIEDEKYIPTTPVTTLSIISKGWAWNMFNARSKK